MSRILGQSVGDPVPDPQFWDAVGNWMIDTVEGSREAGSGRIQPAIKDYAGSGRAPAEIGGESTTELRPLWESIIFDLSFLFGEHVLTRVRAARRGLNGNVYEGSVAGDPRIFATADGGSAVRSARRRCTVCIAGRVCSARDWNRFASATACASPTT